MYVDVIEVRNEIDEEYFFYIILKIRYRIDLEF